MVDGGTAQVGDDVGRRRLQRSLGTPNSVLGEFDFWDGRYEGRRLFSELFGTFLLVLVAVGGGMVSPLRRSGGPLRRPWSSPRPSWSSAIILFMGAVSGAHLNPAVSSPSRCGGDFPWRRVPAYVVAQLLGAVLATLLLRALIGEQGAAGLTLPGRRDLHHHGDALGDRADVGLVSTILGVSSGAQQLGPIAAIGVGSYIALAGLWGSPVSGASMNPARSLGPALVLGDWTSWWAYLAGPIVGASSPSASPTCSAVRGRQQRTGRRPGDARREVAARADRRGAGRRGGGRRRPAGPLRSPPSWGSTSTWPGRPVPRRRPGACRPARRRSRNSPPSSPRAGRSGGCWSRRAPEQVIVVSAPAGSGKTLLLADWVRGSDSGDGMGLAGRRRQRAPAAVVRRDGRPAALPRAAEGPLQRLAADTVATGHAIVVDELADVLDGLDPPVRLVLDDVHELTGREVLHDLARLVRRPTGPLRWWSPAGPTRRSPYPACGWRAGCTRCGRTRCGSPRGHRRTAGGLRARPDAPQVAVLHARTEGWAAGLRLAALALRRTDDVDGVPHPVLRGRALGRRLPDRRDPRRAAARTRRTSCGW